MKRTDIVTHDIFISWTGKDRELKNRIKEYLEKNGLSCKESDSECSGDFRQWSREAVSACNIFLLIYTQNTPDSKYVPEEIKAYKELYDYTNRIIPVCTDRELYRKDPMGINEYGSAVFIDSENPDEDALSKIFYNAERLIVNLLDREYKKAVQPKFLKLIPLYKIKNAKDRELDFSQLYIKRTLTEKDGNNEIINTYSSAEDVLKKDLVFIYGAAGCGKSRYTDEIKEALSEEQLPITVFCRNFTSESIFEEMYKEFKKNINISFFYSEDDFRSLLRTRKLVLIADGLDEISTDEGKRNFIQGVEDYRRIHDGEFKIIFTGRSKKDADLISFSGNTPAILSLDNLKEDDIKNLSVNLFSLFGSEDKKDAFTEHILKLDEDISANPLFISQLAMIYESTGELLSTVSEIYEAVSRIMFGMNVSATVSEIPECYKDMIFRELPMILKNYSMERYNLLSRGKNVANEKIFAHVLKDKYDDYRERAEFTVEYLHNRAIFADDDFYHKMLLEYFTALGYYEKIFDEYDELENKEELQLLMTHYSDPYWSEVIRFFLLKADRSVEEDEIKELYSEIFENDINDYTVIFDVAKEMTVNKEVTQTMAVSDLLVRSARKTLPPYGPLFFYVPEYNLYKTLFAALENMCEPEEYAKCLALARDVCFVFSGRFRLSDITDKADGSKLFSAAGDKLSGIRRELCELFYTDSEVSPSRSDIYPRCFNPQEAKLLKEQGSGIFGYMSEPFSDELDLYSHESLNEVNGEYTGFISCVYNKDELEQTLNKLPFVKVKGIAFSPGEKNVFDYIAIYRKNIEMIYLPENCTLYSKTWMMHLKLRLCVFVSDTHLGYFRNGEKVIIPETPKFIGRHSFPFSCDATELVLGEGVGLIERIALQEMPNLEKIVLPDTIKVIDSKLWMRKNPCYVYLSKNLYYNLKPEIKTSNRITHDIDETEDDYVRLTAKKKFESKINSVKVKTPFEGYDRLKNVKVEKTFLKNYTFEDCLGLENATIQTAVTDIPPRAFKGCINLNNVFMGKKTTISIGESAYEGCVSLKRLYLPDSLQIISDKAFKGCTGISSIFLPNSVKFVGREAFAGCSSVKTIRLFAPEYIAPDAFAGINPELVMLPEGLDLEYDFGEDVKIVYYPLRSKETLTKKDESGTEDETLKGETAVFLSSSSQINIRKYKNRTDIVSVYIEDGIEFIPPLCFDGCVNLKKIRLPKTLVTIDNKAFKGCKNLEELSLPEGLKYINYSAFSGCSKLKELKFGEKIINISGDAFTGCRSLSKIILPPRIRTIGARAFYGCRSAEEISLSANFKNDVKKIFGDIDMGIVKFLY